LASKELPAGANASSVAQRLKIPQAGNIHCNGR